MLGFFEERFFVSENNVVNGRNLLSRKFMGSARVLSSSMSGFDVSRSVAVTVPGNEEHLPLVSGSVVGTTGPYVSPSFGKLVDCLKK